jgi:hypothetical protein
MTGNAGLGNFHGIVINGGVANIIGGTQGGSTRNVISSNGTNVSPQVLTTLTLGDGVLIEDTYTAATLANVVEGNYIGTGKDGVTALGNGHDGVEVTAQAKGNTIGGTAAIDGNTISANMNFGIDLESINNFFDYNYVGLDATGKDSNPALHNGAGWLSDVALNTDGTHNKHN